MAMYPTWPFVGHTRGLIASPPCKAWSMAGKRLGLLDQPLVHAAVEDLAAGRDTALRSRPHHLGACGSCVAYELIGSHQPSIRIPGMMRSHAADLARHTTLSGSSPVSS
jgi:hypothetical protein